MSEPSSAITSGARLVLLLDAGPALQALLNQLLGADYSLRRVAGAAEALALLQRDPIDVVLLNCDRPESRDFFTACARLAAPPPVIALGGALGGEAGPEAAAELLRLGACDYFPQPLRVGELRHALARACQLTDLSRELAAARAPETGPAGFHEAVRDFKRRAVEAALNRNAHNKQRTARALRISRAHLHRLLHQLEIES